MKKGNRVVFWILLILIIIGAPLILGIFLHYSFFNFNNGSADGWLGFWGGYLAALISIGGIYWQVQKSIDTSMESEFKKSRPFVLVSLCPYSNWTHEKRKLYLDSLSSYNNLFNKNLDENYEYSPNISPYLGPLHTILKIENVSDKPLYAVKLNFSNCIENTEICVSRIDANSTIYAFPTKFIEKTSYPLRTKKNSVRSRVVVKIISYSDLKSVEDKVSILNGGIFKKYPFGAELQTFDLSHRSKVKFRIIINYTREIYQKKFFYLWCKKMRFDNMKLYFTSELREIVRLNYESRKKSGHLIPILCYDRENSYVENKDKDIKDVNYEVDGFKESEVIIQEWVN